jgi:hypothetical protein
MKNVAKVANVADYFRTPKRRQFFGGEELVAYDCNQLLTFEENFAHSDLEPIPKVVESDESFVIRYAAPESSTGGCRDVET